ncbi:ABCG2 [Symbiodinium sp. CCMP2456]|nr:ABCG2 [Symbiodinium sp. CCMP2456]
MDDGMGGNLDLYRELAPEEVALDENNETVILPLYPLTPGRWFRLQVSTLTPAGESAPSSEAPPTPVIMHLPSATSVHLSWNASAADHDYICAAYGYQILINSSDGLNESDVLNASVMSYELQGLVPGTHYDFQVRSLVGARFRDSGWSSTLAGGVPSQMLPPVLVTDLSTVSVAYVGWTAPDMNFGVPVGYELLLSLSSVSDLVSVSLVPDAAGCSVSALTPETLYRFQVRALNQLFGAGPLSDIAEISVGTVPTVQPPWLEDADNCSLNWRWNGRLVHSYEFKLEASDNVEEVWILNGSFDEPRLGLQLSVDSNSWPELVYGRHFRAAIRSVTGLVRDPNVDITAGIVQLVAWDPVTSAVAGSSDWEELGLQYDIWGKPHPNFGNVSWENLLQINAHEDTFPRTPVNSYWAFKLRLWLGRTLNSKSTTADTAPTGSHEAFNLASTSFQSNILYCRHFHRILQNGIQSNNIEELHLSTGQLPSAPLDLSGVANDTVVLSWQIPSLDGFVPITHYEAALPEIGEGMGFAGNTVKPTLAALQGCELEARCNSDPWEKVLNTDLSHELQASSGSAACEVRAANAVGTGPSASLTVTVLHYFISLLPRGVPLPSGAMKPTPEDLSVRLRDAVDDTDDTPTFPDERGPSSGLMRQVRECSRQLSQEANVEEISMEWTDLTFTIGSHQILSNITGMIQPGKLTGVFGPSGSGKTTLLNILAGRQNTKAGGMSLSGQITTGGVPVDPVSFRSNIAYVMQDDSLLPFETPRECLYFSACLRLPRSVTEEQRQEFVQSLLNTLHLERCSTTIVGSALVKGISGGERKRTSVGIELITNPRMLFLDEPLSGLDSYAAYTLVIALKELAEANVPVLCTVHQPSSEIFAKFDDVIILHGGEVTYHGPAEHIATHFDVLGYPCPSNFNPADHVMFLLQKEMPEKLQNIKTAWLDSGTFKKMHEQITNFRGQGNARPSSVLPEQTGASFCQQLAMLLVRETRGTIRNKGVLFARLGMSLFLACMYGWLFSGSAAQGDNNHSTEKNCVPNNFSYAGCQSDWQAHFGTIVSLSIMAMMGAAQPVLLQFPQERPVFLREYAAHQSLCCKEVWFRYGVVPYFISKTIVEMPVVLLAQIVTFLVTYWWMGLHGSVLLLVLVSWGLGVTSSSLALLVGCGVSTAQKAIQLAPLTLIPQMLFSGLFVPVAKIPLSLRWVRYLCPLKYAINLMTIVEFSYVKENIDNCEQEYSQAQCEAQCLGREIFSGLGRPSK